MKLKSFALPLVLGSVLVLGACATTPSTTTDEPSSDMTEPMPEEGVTTTPDSTTMPDSTTPDATVPDSTTAPDSN